MEEQIVASYSSRIAKADSLSDESLPPHYPSPFERAFCRVPTAPGTGIRLSRHGSGVTVLSLDPLAHPLLDNSSVEIKSIAWSNRFTVRPSFQANGADDGKIKWKSGVGNGVGKHKVFSLISDLF
jgi:hypothetical protein